MQARHLEQMAQIERDCFSMPMSMNQLRSELDSEITEYEVMEDDEGTVLGYAGLTVVLDEGYITNVAVREDMRGCGIASRLMERMIERARDLIFLTLEVRVTNDAAIGLYEKYGFTVVGTRKHYYKKPQEDALIMTRFFYNGGDAEC